MPNRSTSSFIAKTRRHIVAVTPIHTSGGHLACITGWKSESIRHWVKSGLLAGEPTETRGQMVYWVGLRAVHDFMGRYKVVSGLAHQLKTTPKALSDKLHKMGVPILGA